MHICVEETALTWQQHLVAFLHAIGNVVNLSVRTTFAWQHTASQACGMQHIMRSSV
jgi:hypothetical protein